MKISYNTLKRFKKDIKSPENLAEDLIMHTAEVEEIIYEGQSFNNMVLGEIKEINTHPDADKLKVCMVDIGDKKTQIVCGGTNLELGQKVAVAKIGSTVSWHGEETITMKKTKIRGIESNGMICASEEIGLDNEFPAKSHTEILDLSHLNGKIGENLAEVLNKNEVILEIDNKAINHRPDLFSHIGILREIYTICGEKFDYEYANKDFSSLSDLGIKNKIPEVVKRYIGLKISGVKHIKSPDYIKEVLNASGVSSKGLLVDLSNYSLYLYGQPTHIFDADKISGNITIRFAKAGEKFLALDDKEYELSQNDIVIADEEKILALGGIIGGKQSAVTENTTNIIIEGANFDHSILRASGKKIGIRTDALNVFEKDLLPISAQWGVSLIVSELEKIFPEMKLETYSDSYSEKQQEIEINYDLDFINKLIGKKYAKEQTYKILQNLGVEIKNNNLIIPTWRKDLNYKSDIAEEIARIDGYNKVDSNVPKIQLGAIIQDNIYKLKKQARDFFVENGFFDTYTYSFVNKELLEKCNSNLENHIALKNFLSNDATHMKASLIPNLLQALENNYRDFKKLELFEIEKVFSLVTGEVKENYNLAGIISKNKDVVYYDIQNLIAKFLKFIGVKYQFKALKNTLNFAHKTRTAEIIARGQNIGYVGEISPKVAKNFEQKARIGFFEINLELLSTMLGTITKAKDLSEFQGSNFDISFVVNKDFEGKKLHQTLEKIDPIIEKVELFDIYENEEKLPGQRSLSFKVYLQKSDSEVVDKEKNDIIEKMVQKAEKLGAKLR